MNLNCKITGIALLCLLATPAAAAKFACTVTHKMDPTGAYTQDRITDDNFSILLKVDDNEDQDPLNDTAAVTSCAEDDSDNKVCDTFEIDKIVFDDATKLKKYYNFHSQYDLQVFQDLSFVENNGRGATANGTCKITSD